MIGWFGINILTSDIFWIRLEIKLWSLTRFSSPQLKASVSFSDRLLSVVCPSLCKLFTFSSCFTEPHYQFQSNLAQKIQDCSIEGPRPFPRGDNYKIAMIYWRILKNLRLQNPGVNYDHTWHKVFFDKGNKSVLKWSVMVFPRGDKYGISKMHWGNFKTFFFLFCYLESTFLNQYQWSYKGPISRGRGDSGVG